MIFKIVAFLITYLIITLTWEKLIEPYIEDLEYLKKIQNLIQKGNQSYKIYNTRDNMFSLK
jgi:hypothetical protein